MKDTACLNDQTLEMELTKSASLYFWPMESKAVAIHLPVPTGNIFSEVKEN